MGLFGSEGFSLIEIKEFIIDGGWILSKVEHMELAKLESSILFLLFAITGAAAPETGAKGGGLTGAAIWGCGFGLTSVHISLTAIASEVGVLVSLFKSKVKLEST